MSQGEKVKQILEKQEKLKRKFPKSKDSVNDEIQLAAKKFKSAQRVFVNGSTFLLDETSTRNMGMQLHIANYGHYITFG